MFEFVYDLPLVITGPAIVGSLCLFAVVGLLVVRRRVLPRLRIQVEDSEFTGAMMAGVMVFYGLATSFIAVNVFQTHSDVSKVLSQEATALSVLYHAVGGYHEPVGSQLQKELRDYVDNLIHEAWPLQQRGKIPFGGVERMNRFQAILLSSEPATEGEKLLHTETLGAYNNMVQARRLRLDALNTGLPAVMWAVIIVGALISLSSSFFFKVEDARLHGIQVLLLAVFIAVVILLIFVLDRPFRGDLGLGPDSYQLIYDQMMKP